MNDILNFLTEPFTHPFMVRAIVTTVIAAVSCSMLSCWLVQIGWSLMGDAVSHAVLPGVVISYALGWPFAIGAFIFGVGAVAIIGGLQSSTTLKSDTAIGVVFTSLFALGLVLITLVPSQVDLNHILFGNVLGVSPGDLIQGAIIGGISCSLLLLKRRDFTLFAFDPVHAHALGINTRVLRMMLLGLLALVVVISLQSVGIILVVAMLIIPGATGLLVSARMGRVLIVAAVATVLATLVGSYVSYYANISTGGSIVLAQSTLFALAYLLGPRGGIIPGRLRARAATLEVAPKVGAVLIKG
ncbi:metal ABC transporter permease [Mycetocola spongiae]|uniref:metal ABC transporter permease n=1 Tax=Mycetocola spongiae TaxID=2859226 RepID=UPI00299EB320|nr:metal ABC transporter permease [Mycetocola spongiae]